MSASSNFTPWPTSFAFHDRSRGISSLHGPHHAAQKFTHVKFPFMSIEAAEIAPAESITFTFGFLGNVRPVASAHSFLGADAETTAATLAEGEADTDGVADPITDSERPGGGAACF